ncbi:MAG TPA: hypothetical protein PKX48_15565 [Planctomycetota bacterium]|jgi:disulfide bond formation protein DsbB|nr:hypothetical protein [Planctomycetota bacterium]OQC19082.1 MAG: hypothetical protein BWX69_03003 [Planctomycetes bacterium ADurb.Bin069]HNS00529.1 hypothetical protein [Planctomycetota bacterium]HNU27231.1 hypothetical protein [Planctomycetota bacterium]HOE31144.1 hypothetical protein [Planctomycetota bacterium]
MARKIRYWETREFRWLVLILVMAAAVLAVLVFEIAPMMEARARRGAARVEGGLKAALPADTPPVDRDDPRWTGMLAGVKDGEEIEQASLQYRALVAYLSAAAPEAIAEEAVPVEYPLFTTAADSLRGRAVRIKALYLDSFAVALEAKAGDVEFIYRAFLVDPSGNDGYVVDLITPPPRFAMRTPVETEALFFKLGTYEGRRGPKASPQFVARELRELGEAPAAFLGEETATWRLGALFALCLLLLTAWAFFQWRLTRRSRAGRSPAGTPPGPGA